MTVRNILLYYMQLEMISSKNGMNLLLYCPFHALRTCHTELLRSFHVRFHTFQCDPSSLLNSYIFWDIKLCSPLKVS